VFVGFIEFIEFGGFAAKGLATGRSGRQGPGELVPALGRVLKIRYWKGVRL